MRYNHFRQTARLPQNPGSRGKSACQKKGMVKNMFNMTQVGGNICRLRKAAGYTQMELADTLGISFQAVSNWERGVSMPDISKLNELSELFGVSIDEILENKRVSEIAKNVIENRPTIDINIREIKEIAPILRDEQTDALLSQTAANGIDADEFASVAPFLSEDFIDDYAKKLLAENPQSMEPIMPIIAFVSEDVIDESAVRIVEKTGDLRNIVCAAAFISGDLLDYFADTVFEKTKDIHSILPIVAFVSEDKIDEIARKVYAESGINAVVPIAHFVFEDTLNEMAKETLKKHGIKGISPIMSFIDSEIIEDYIAGRIEK